MTKFNDITEDEKFYENSQLGLYGQVICPTILISNLIDWGIEDPKGNNRTGKSN